MYPGESAINDVSLEKRPQTPALEMLHLDLVVQNNAVSCDAHPGAEFNVLDGWTTITTLVEPAKARNSSRFTAPQPLQKVLMSPLQA